MNAKLPPMPDPHRARHRIGLTCLPGAGGSGVLATELAHHLADQQHEVHIVTSHVPHHLDRSRPHLHHHPVQPATYATFPHPPQTLALAGALARVAAAHQLDLLHMHYAVPFATAGWLACQLHPGLKLVTTLHGTDVTGIGAHPDYAPTTRLALQRSDAVTAPSDWLAHQARVRFDLPDLPITVVPNFTDTDRFVPGPAPAGLPVLVHVSNFREVKRVDKVVTAFAAVRQRVPCRLRLVGDGPEHARVVQQIASLGLTDAVELTGDVRNPAPLLAGCAAFLLTSDSESFGLAALEAQAAGVPVVALRVGGLPEVLEHGRTGMLCDDLDGVIASTTQLLSQPAMAQAVGVAARQSVQARFAPGPAVHRYLDVYDAIVAKEKKNEAGV